MRKVSRVVPWGPKHLSLAFFSIMKHFPDDFRRFLAFYTPFLAKKHVKSRQKPSQSVLRIAPSTAGVGSQGSQGVIFSTEIFCLKNFPNVFKTVFQVFLSRFQVFSPFIFCFPTICSRFCQRFSPVVDTNSFFYPSKYPKIDQKWEQKPHDFVLALTSQPRSRWGPNLTKSCLPKPVFLA